MKHIIKRSLPNISFCFVVMLGLLHASTCFAGAAETIDANGKGSGTQASSSDPTDASALGQVNYDITNGDLKGNIAVVLCNQGSTTYGVPCASGSQ